MKTLIISMAALVITVITNPSQEKHRDIVKEKLNKLLDKLVPNNEASSSNTVSMISDVLSNSLINQTINEIVTSDNYLLFSITKLSRGDKNTSIGFGFLGNVFLSGELDRIMLTDENDVVDKKQKPIVQKTKKNKGFLQSIYTPEMIKLNEKYAKQHRKEVEIMKEHMRWLDKQEANGANQNGDVVEFDTLIPQ